MEKREIHPRLEGEREKCYRKGISRRKALQFVGLSAAGLMAARCAPSATEMVPQPTLTAGPYKEPILGGSLIASSMTDITGLDPATIVGVGNAYISYLTRSALCTLDWKGELTPDLAESWQHEDGKRWIFNLRKGVLFHTGRELTADDVIYTYNRIMDPEVGSPARDLFTPVTRIGKEDDYTVVFELNQPNLDFPAYHNAYQTKILPHDQPVNEHATNPIGTGPFILEESVPGERAILRRNSNYFIEGAPYLDEVVLLVMLDSATRTAALQSGTIHVCPDITWENYLTLKADPNVTVVSGLPITQLNIFMNVTRPPFDDKRVRDAMRYIVDREAINKATVYGEGIASCDTPIIPGNPYRKDAVGICEQDIEKAKQLLTEAGYSDLTLELWTPAEDPTYLNMALAFQEQAKAANVKIELRAVSDAIYWGEKWLTADIGVSGWGARPSADAQIRLEYACGGDWNESRFCSPEMEKLLDKALVETNEAERKELYGQVQEIIATEGGTIIPFFMGRIMAHRNNLMNIHLDPFMSMHDLREVWIAPEA